MVKKSFCLKLIHENKLINDDIALIVLIAIAHDANFIFFSA